ncbi:glycoside hydrolase family 71/99-like protein [Pedobacter sp. UBA5917]|jgi:hypothetical protein|uniref:glycoside hydrolase family 71/99-like protein n=1 Tax=Pedobacter sp. UBA5917 TaxID=1947061 RepID=UPI0025DE82A5|nr:glycoside hydrolase family 71/99-like protein [Pedobacter sp. UBA5917]
MKKTTIYLLAASLLWAGCKKENSQQETSLSTEKLENTKAIAAFQTIGVVGKVYTGYQGWFSAPGDGSPLNAWIHWGGNPPAPGALTFEAYPDMSEYAATSLFQSGFANLGNGAPAKLFSSYKADVVNKHFQWMQQAGIDGAAVQRFLNPNTTIMAHRNAIAVNAKNAAEAYDRSFYIMYDLNSADQQVKDDWLNVINTQLNLTASPNYAREGGKPVVCIWGYGFTSRVPTATQALDIINWFKAQGCYVIGGVPRDWRTSTGGSKPGFENVYKAYNMISPWAVGSSDPDSYNTNYTLPDKAYCATNGMAYQPVMYVGFAWSNWNGGPVNQIPRNKGQFFWKWAYHFRNASIPSAYIAMFDEFDEATNIAKTADSYLDIPTNQHFLTTSADGTYLSSDFYLRLSGKAIRMIKGLDPLTNTVPIPASAGPRWLATSFQLGYDGMPTWTDSPDQTAINTIGFGATGNPVCGVVTNETNHLGNASIRVAGRDNSATGSNVYFKIFDVDIPVTAGTKLRFWKFPTNTLSRYVTVDLVMTDGTTLRDSGAQDQNGALMHPGTAKGTVNTWAQTTCTIGSWLNGKTIDKILIAYDHAADTGDFKAYIDDIVIEN